MIRQAISCDICGAEKKQTNHWFVAYEASGELRVSGWTSRNRLRAGSKHLCGQVCLHKLADDFMARVIAGKANTGARANAAQEEAEIEMESAAELAEEMQPVVPAAAAKVKREPVLPAAAANVEMEPPARLAAAPLPIAPRPLLRPASDIGTVPERPHLERAAAPPAEEPADVTHDGTTRDWATRRWRAAAWERERERALRGADCRPELVSRRISQV